MSVNTFKCALYIYWVCNYDLQEVHLIVDRCSGAMVNEVEGLGVDMFETDQSACKVSAHTPGSER